MEGLDRFYRMLVADHRAHLDGLVRGRVVEDLHIDGHLRYPETPSDAKWRTMDLRPEDRIDPDNARRDMLYRPGQDKPEIMPLSAKGNNAGSGAYPAEDDGSGRSSLSKADPDEFKTPDDLMLEPGAKYRDPDEWRGKLGETVGNIGGAAADVAKSAWINATGSPQEVKDNLSNLSKEYRAKGYTKAVDNLDHFLNGKGAAKTIPRDEARKDSFIRDAEIENRKRFETKTFLGKTDENDDVNDGLRNLKDGETIELKDDWSVNKGDTMAVIDGLADGKAGRDDFLAEGARKFASNAKFTAKR